MTNLAMDITNFCYVFFMNKEKVFDNIQSVILTKVLSSRIALTDIDKNKTNYNLTMTVDEE
jgi:hypothetical protein